MGMMRFGCDVCDEKKNIKKNICSKQIFSIFKIFGKCIYKKKLRKFKTLAKIESFWDKRIILF